MAGEYQVIGPVGKTMDLKYSVMNPCKYGDTDINEDAVIEAEGLEFDPRTPSGIVLVGDIVDKTYIQRVPLDVLDLSGINEEKVFIREFDGVSKGSHFKLDEVDVDSQPLTAFGWVIKRIRIRVCVSNLHRITGT